MAGKRKVNEIRGQDRLIPKHFRKLQRGSGWRIDGSWHMQNGRDGVKGTEDEMERHHRNKGKQLLLAVQFGGGGDFMWQQRDLHGSQGWSKKKKAGVQFQAQWSAARSQGTASRWRTVDILWAELHWSGVILITAIIDPFFKPLLLWLAKSSEKCSHFIFLIGGDYYTKLHKTSVCPHRRRKPGLLPTSVLPELHPISEDQSTMHSKLCLYIL